MADYYPLLARALDALPDRSPALRKAVYDRARSALIAQLRSLDPPVSEADIDLERKGLDTAIERLEADYAAPAAKPGDGKPEPAKPAPLKPEAAREVAKQPAKTGAKADAQPETRPSKPQPPKPAPTEKAPPPPPPPKPSKETREQVPEPGPPTPPADPLPLPEPSAAETLPEAGPPPDFVPFVPPPRKPKPDFAPPLPTEGEAPPASEDAAPAVPPPDPASAARRPRIDVVAPRAGRSRLLRNAVVGGILVVVIGLIAVAAFMLRDRPAELSQGGEAEGSQNEQADSKFADRVGGGAEPERRAPAGAKPQPEVTVAQSAVLYDENTADPRATPKATQGRVVWRLEPVSGEQGQPLQSAVRATVDFPDAGFSLTMTIRKNLDATFPASHLIELVFKGQGDERTVQEVGLPQLKDEQNGRGAPLAGQPSRILDNYFWIALSNQPNDIERNTELLTRKNWIDIGVRFKSGPRGVLAFDKGTAGTQVMQSAFDQWKQ